MEWRSGMFAASTVLCLFSLCNLVASEDDQEIMDNDNSRKLLGSSVVTSVSVIMEHGNGSKTVIKDGSGVNPQIVGTPGSFLSPDRYEFYSLDDSGDLVKRLMSLEEIQSLIAASRPELAAPNIPIYYHRPLVEPDIADEGVQNVLANVQSVLREELAKERDPPKPQPLPIDDSWSLLLPGLFGADLDFKQEPMLSRPVQPTTDSFPSSVPTDYSSNQEEPSYAQVPQGTTFGVLPPLTHSQTSPKPFEPPTTKPVKYSAHYTTVKTPILPEKQPENNLHPISASTLPPKKPPKTSSSTSKPSTIIHYLPIQSIEPVSNNLGQQPKPKPDKNKPEFTTSSPVKKTTPANKIPPKLTTLKPTVFPQEYNYNKTYQRITVKPNTNKQPSQASKPIKSTLKPTTSSSSFKPNYSSSKPNYSSSKPLGTSSKPNTKPYIKTTRKPEVNFATEYQIVETVGTRRPPTAVMPHSTTSVPVKKPSPTKGTYGSGSKYPTPKPSANKPPNTGKPLLSSAPTDNVQQVKPSLTTNHQSFVHKTEAPLKSTIKPSVGPVKVTLSQSTKPVKPLKTSPATKRPASTTALPTSSVSNKKPSSTTPPNPLADTIELMPITQDDEVMASSAAALIQDLLRTETNKDLFTKPTSYSTVSGNPMTSFPSTLLTTTIKTRPTTFATSRTPTTKRPTLYSTKPTNNSPVTSQKYTSTDRTTLTTSFNYNMTRKPIIQKFPSPHTVSPVSRRPPQPTTKPVIQTTQTFRPFTTSKEPENLSNIKSESLTQSNPSLESNQLLSGSQKKPTEITLIPINDLKKYSSLSQLINAKPDIIEKRTTTPPSTKATSTSLPTTVKKKDNPVTTVMPTTSYSESENDLINTDMIYQVISTLQSNTNKITYPTTIGDYITSTMRTFETEATTNTDSSDPLITTVAATEVFNLKLKNKENIKLKLKPTEKNPESNTVTTDSWTYTQPITSERTMPTKLISTKPTNHQTEKINNKIQSGWKFGNIISTSAQMEMQTEGSSTLSEELTSTMSTNYDETTTELSTQDTSTNYLEDEAIQEGISAVANLLLDDSNMLRHMGKPDNVEELTSTTDYTTTEGIPSTTSDSLDTTTELDDLSLLRMDMSTDEYGPSDSDLSTTMDPISTTSTDSIIPTTTEVNKLDQKAKEEIMQNDGEMTITTIKVTTKATTIVSSQPTTSRTPTKAPVSKIKTNLTPTKESKLNPDDPIEATLTTQSQHKVNTTTKEKQKNKVSTNRPVKYTTPKPLSQRLPGEKPTRMPLPKLNKTSSAHVNSTSPVKTELKNVLNDKFFKKPGVNSYQPNVQPPPSIDLHPAPQESLGLEASTAFLQEDIKKFSDLLNEIGFRLWTSISGKGGISSRSFVLSPFAATSMLAMVFLGARGPTSGQMNDILRLDDMVTFNPHQVLKNVTESVINSKNLGVATASFVRELYSDKFKGKILDFYKERVHQYYDGHVEEVNFNAIGDIVRRRTNLLVKRQTLGKLPEYLRGSSLNMRPPLAAFTANIFQSDCEAASTEGRDGEMYFVVRPSTRQRRLVPVPAVVWRTSFLAGYEPSLDATSVCLGADSVVSTILVLPGQQGQVAPGDGLARLEQRLIETSFRRGSWSKLLRSLLPRPGLELQLPRFSHRSVLNITQALRHMGLKDLFTSRADLRGLNGVSNDLHLSDMVQVNTFSTCGEEKVGARHHTETYPSSAIRIGRHHDVTRSPRGLNLGGEEGYIRRQRQARLTEDWLVDRRYKRSTENASPELNDELENINNSELHKNGENKDHTYLDVSPEELTTPITREDKQLRLTETPRLRFDRPFLYMIRHNPTGIILHMGRFNPRLLP